MGDKIDVKDDNLNLTNYFDLLHDEYNILSNTRVRPSIATSDFEQYKNAYRSTISLHYSNTSDEKDDEFNYVTGTLTHFNCILASHVLVDTLQIFKIQICKIKSHISPPVGLFDWRLISFQNRINKKNCLDLILFMNEGASNAMRAKYKIDLESLDNILAATMYELLQNNSFGYLENKNKEINHLKSFISNIEICYNQIIFSKIQLNNLFPFEEERNAIQKLKQMIDWELTDYTMKYNIEKHYILKMNESKHNQCIHQLNGNINKQKKIINDIIGNRSIEMCVTNEVTNFYHYKITKQLQEIDTITNRYEQESEDADLLIGSLNIRIENMKNRNETLLKAYNKLQNKLNCEMVRRYKKKIAKRYFIIWRYKIKVRKLFRLYNGDQKLVDHYLMCELRGLPLPELPPPPIPKIVKSKKKLNQKGKKK